MRELSFFDMARSADVKRWHIINTVRPQTVAEHSFMVALIAMELAKHIVPHGSLFDSPREQFQFLCAALFHDMPETITGDLPTPAKQVYREFSQNPRMFDEMDMLIMPKIPYSDGMLNAKLVWLIKVADLIEAYHFLCNNAAGPYAKVIRNDLWKRVVALTVEASQAMPDMLWCPAVGTVLRDMGLTGSADVLRGEAEQWTMPNKDPRI